MLLLPPVEPLYDEFYPSLGLAGFFEPPLQFISNGDYWNWNDSFSGPYVAVHTGRLDTRLRRAASRHDSRLNLIESAIVRISATRSGEIEGGPIHSWSDALADLAVTGRAAYMQFLALNPTEDALVDAVIRRASTARPIMGPVSLPLRPPPTVEEARQCLQATLDRAYRVLWVLRGAPSHRCQRPDLGWIAVSGEDDAPHFPVNVSTIEDPMGEINFVYKGQAIACRISIKLATPVPALPLPDPTRPIREQSIRTLPTEAWRQFYDLIGTNRHDYYDDLILYIHGLGSRIEEGDRFKQRLIEYGKTRGKRYAVLSIDLPGFGFSSRLDYDAVVQGHPAHFDTDNPLRSHFPFFDLYKYCLENLSNHIAGGIQYILGGSLGGNLTLQMAEIHNDGRYILPGTVRKFVSWSPASIWESYEWAGTVGRWDLGKNGSKNRTHDRMNETETRNRRYEWFKVLQRGEEIIPGIWRHGGWGYPAKPWGLLDQAEIYGPQWRRTFWAVSYEQLIFSHQEPLAYGGQWPFRTINRPLYILSGEEDDGEYGVTDYYNNVQKVTNMSRSVPGRRMLLRRTHHSIHDDRPDLLASHVVRFFTDAPIFTFANSCIVVAPELEQTGGNDFWVMKYDRTSGQWEHQSPIVGHSFGADLNCDAGSPANFGVRFAVTGDFDGDGQEEIAFAPNASSGTGQNDFWVMKFNQVSRQWEHLSPNPAHVFGADLNCDLGLDLPVNFGVKFAVAGDFDADGQDELAIALNRMNPIANDFWVMKFNRDTGQWGHLSPIAGHEFGADLICSSSVNFGVRFAVVGDFDGDYQEEIAVAPDVPSGTGQNDFWVMKFNRNFGKWEHLCPGAGFAFDADLNCDLGLDTPTNFGVKFVVVGDFNGDGQEEIAIAFDAPSGTGQNDFWVMKFNRSSTQWEHMSPIPGHDFGADLNCDMHLVHPVEFGVKFAVVGDLDGDGQDEIVVAPDAPNSTTQNDFWIMKFNRKSREWEHLSPISGHDFGADMSCNAGFENPTNLGVNFAVIGDFDGDGQEEVAVAPDAPSGTGQNDFWVMKFNLSSTEWEHMSPIAEHVFGADLNCDMELDHPVEFGMKFAVVSASNPKSGSLVAVMRGPEELDILAVAIDSRIYHSSYLGRHVWSSHLDAWKSIGGKFPKAASVSAICRRENSIESFIVGKDGKVYTNSWRDGLSDWTGVNDNWFPIGSMVFPKSAHVTSVARRSSQADLFVVGANGKMYTSSHEDGLFNNFSEWRDIGGGTFLPNTYITAVARKSGQLDLFAIDKYGLVLTSSWTEGVSDWSGIEHWRNIGGVTFPSGALVAAISRKPEQLDIFAVTEDGRVYTTWRSEGMQSWSVWRDIGGVFPPGAPIAAVARKPSQIDLFAIAADGHVYTSWWTEGVSDWSGIGDRWRNIGGLFSAGSPVAAIARKPGQLDLFAISSNGHVYTSWWTEGFSDWSGLDNLWELI